MRLSSATGNPEYARLRAEYDTAFERLSVELRKLQSLDQDPASPPADLEAGRRRVEEAFREYHERRDRLAVFLSNFPAPPSERLRVLAYHLWEQAGRPLDRPDEYWYRAENQLRRSA